MDFNIKDYPEQDLPMLVHSLELVSARIFESLVTINQTACANTPEMKHMFNEWISCLGDTVSMIVKEDGSIDPEKVAKQLGVSPATVLSLCLTLHRQGSIKITGIKAERTNDENREICNCMKK